MAQLWKKKLQKDKKIIQVSKWKIIEQKEMQKKYCKCICKNSMLKGKYENGITQKCIMFGLLFC